MGGRALVALFEPAPSVTRVDHRRDARLLAAVLAVIVALGTSSAFAQLAFVPGFFPTFCVIVAAMAILLAAFGLSRTVHFRTGAALAVLVCLLACFATLASNPSDATAPAFMFVPVLVATAFLPLRAAGAIAASSVIGLATLGVLGRADPHALWAGGAFFVIASSLALLVAWHRARVETDRHAALAESEGRHRALFQAAFEGLIVLRDGAVLDANVASARSLGLATSTLMGARFVELFDGDSRVTAERFLCSDDRKTELAGTRSGGSPFAVEVVAQRTRERDGASIVVLGVRDLAEQRRVEAEMRRMDRLSALGTLTAGVAHEINNPLAYAMLTLEALETGRHAPSEGPELLREVREEMKRIDGIVRTLKGLARAEEDSVAQVDVGAAVESSLRLASVQLPPGTKVVRDFQPVPRIKSNPTKLRQVFLNLVVNAIQAVEELPPGRREIIVRVAPTPEGNVEVVVRDSGVGMAADVLDRIFDPFFTTKPVGVGTGLGLSICHGIVTSLGGHIAVESQRGRGSTFRVTLPGLPARSVEGGASCGS
jgi:PAS domain S-box-containing protein